MIQQKPVNLGFWIIDQMNLICDNSRILFGSILTRLAERAKSFNLSLLNPVLPQQITFNSFDDMGYFNIYNHYLFCEPGFTPLAEHARSKNHKGKWKFIDINSEKGEANSGRSQEAGGSTPR